MYKLTRAIMPRPKLVLRHRSGSTRLPPSPPGADPAEGSAARCPQTVAGRPASMTTRRPWSAQCSGLNLGVRLPADVVVVDVDPRNFPEGRQPGRARGRRRPRPRVGSPRHHRQPGPARPPLLLPQAQGRGPQRWTAWRSRAWSSSRSAARSSRQVDCTRRAGATVGARLTRLCPRCRPAAETPGDGLRPERNTASDAGEINPEHRAVAGAPRPDRVQDRDRWRRLMMACHHATDGEGRQEFIDWSTSDPAYADHEWLVGRRWDSCTPTRTTQSPSPPCASTLIEAGADVEPSDPEDDFDVWEEDAEPAQPQRRRSSSPWTSWKRFRRRSG